MKRFPVAGVLAGIGLALVLAGFGVLVRFRVQPTGSGWDDLAAFAGFLLLALAAGGAFAAALVAARTGRGRLHRWAVAGAVAGALLGLLPLATLATSALTGGHAWLGAALVAVALVEAAGLASAPGAWRRAAGAR